jgi:hypothetical protein
MNRKHRLFLLYDGTSESKTAKTEGANRMKTLKQHDVALMAASVAPASIFMHGAWAPRCRQNPPADGRTIPGDLRRSVGATAANASRHHCQHRSNHAGLVRPGDGSAHRGGAMPIKARTPTPNRQMQITRLLFACCLVYSAVGSAVGDEPKNHDQDVVCDEAEVPLYDLPPLLMSSEGTPITTPEEWFTSEASPAGRRSHRPIRRRLPQPSRRAFQRDV